MPDPVGLGGEGKAPDPASSAPDAVRHRATLEAPEGPGPQGGGGKEQDAPQGAASKKRATTGDSASAELLLPERNEGLDAPGEVPGP